MAPRVRVGGNLRSMPKDMPCCGHSASNVHGALNDRLELSPKSRGWQIICPNTARSRSLSEVSSYLGREWRLAVRTFWVGQESEYGRVREGYGGVGRPSAFGGRLQAGKRLHCAHLRDSSTTKPVNEEFQTLGLAPKSGQVYRVPWERINAVNLLFKTIIPTFRQSGDLTAGNHQVAGAELRSRTVSGTSAKNQGASYTASTQPAAPRHAHRHVLISEFILEKNVSGSENNYKDFRTSLSTFHRHESTLGFFLLRSTTQHIPWRIV
ncbi:hypothetical protein FA13DRAFT_1773990, partial [Coprinellus micaceus]